MPRITSSHTLVATGTERYPVYLCDLTSGSKYDQAKVGLRKDKGWACFGAAVLCHGIVCLITRIHWYVRGRLWPSGHSHQLSGHTGGILTAAWSPTSDHLLATVSDFRSSSSSNLNACA